MVISWKGYQVCKFESIENFWLKSRCVTVVRQSHHAREIWYLRSWDLAHVIDLKIYWIAVSFYYDRFSYQETPLFSEGFDFPLSGKSLGFSRNQKGKQKRWKDSVINRKIFGNALTKIVFLEKNRKKRKTPLSKRSFRFFSEKIIFVSLWDHFVTPISYFLFPIGYFQEYFVIKWISRGSGTVPGWDNALLYFTTNGTIQPFGLFAFHI